MTDKRIIGIDFGTSTSVIRVKSYQQNGQPINSKLDTKAVTFNNGVTTVPTLVQRVNDAFYFGHDAKVAKKGAELFRNFKLDLQSADAEKKEEAKKLTKEFFKYLYKEYHAQANGGHLGSIEEEESTIVSYPVKWNNETREFMLQAAKEAGFITVTGMDEAEAAIRAVTVQCEDLLKQKRYLVQNNPVNILLIDMGAGTTDLVLCRFTPGEKPKNEIITTWPKEGDLLFGGRETDEILKDYISGYIPDAFRKMLAPNLEANGTYKAWKEELVSPSLLAGNGVTEFSAADTLLQMMGSELDEFCLDRKEFENTAKNYLNSFPKLINGCLKSAGINGDQIDLVITTGGHSQWYFVKEFLSGKMSEFESVNLNRIKSDPNRIIGVSLPQETVALGLAYSGISSSFVAEDDTQQKAEETKNASEDEKVEKVENLGSLENKDKESEKAYSDAFSLLTDITGLEEVLKHTFEKVKAEKLDYSKETRDTTKEFFKNRYQLLCEEWPDRFQYENMTFIENAIEKMDFPKQDVHVNGSGTLKGGGKGAAVGAVAGSFIPVIGTAMGAVIGGTIGLMSGFGDDSTNTDNSILNTMNFVKETVLFELCNCFSEMEAKNKDTNNKKNKNISRTDFLCPVEDVFSISGRGTVVTGKIERGTVKVGDTVEIVGLSNQVKTAVIDGIEMYRKTCDSAKEGDNVGLLLKGIGRDEVKRGQVICKPGSVKAGKSFKAEIRFITKEEGGSTDPILESDRYLFSFRTLRIAAGTIKSSTGKGVNMPGEMDMFYVDLDKPVALEEGLHFVIRKGEKNIGVGNVIEISD